MKSEIRWAFLRLCYIPFKGYFPQVFFSRKPWKNVEFWFLFHLKSLFCPRDFLILVLPSFTLWAIVAIEKL